MRADVPRRQLDADGEEARREHDAQELERDGVAHAGRVGPAPGARGEDVGAVRADEHAEARAEDDFADVELGRQV